MFTALLIVLAVAGVWAAAAIAVAFLAGGMIHARDHQDVPFGGFTRPRAVLPASGGQHVAVRMTGTHSFR